MANEKPIPPHDDAVRMPQHPGDGGEDKGFTGYGDTTGKRNEAAYGRPLPPLDQDVAGERKRQHEAESRAADAARRNSYKRGR